MTCCIEGCFKPVKARGWCSTHNARWERHGDPTVLLKMPAGSRPCWVAGCDRPARGRGLCQTHYQRWRVHGDVCADVPIPAKPGQIQEYLNPPPPACVDCGAVTWGGTIRCEPCLRADLARRVEAKPVASGEKNRLDPGRTAVRRVSLNLRRDAA